MSGGFSDGDSDGVCGRDGERDDADREAAAPPSCGDVFEVGKPLGPGDNGLPSSSTSCSSSSSSSSSDERELSSCARASARPVTRCSS
eukprot:7387891-Prymnesium_polylepis.1